MAKEYLTLHLIALAIGYLLDLLIGDPNWMWHPVILIGRIISWFEKKLLNITSDKRDDRKEFKNGMFTCFLVCIITVMLTSTVLITAYVINIYLGTAIEAILTCFILAAKSLNNESMKVYHDLVENDDKKARYDLSMIVGRDTDRLDRNAIVRATVETVAENTSDGVIAPLLYTAIAGPVLGMLYKAINTMDSMIGYDNERYRYYGRAAAKLDDIVNFIPSRISAVLMIAACMVLSLFDGVYDPGASIRIWRRDRLNHKSPNSAQTESACAGALRIKLGGDSYYGGVRVSKPYIGDNNKNIENEDIKRANRLMFLSEAILMLIIVYIMIRIM
ncbi:MAG: adenosylcobinamide-phosphate synthase CbiB [Lachnospiraceae bacterium]|nr:adenosylcobinamide-phosphate synthase CbiB [Lachnospiraceae bacterium]